jgi:hypothetical protein
VIIAAQHISFGSTVLSGAIAGVLATLAGAALLRGLGFLLGWPKKVVKRLDAQDKILDEHTDALAALTHQMHPNGGDSAVDKINEIYKRVVGPLPKPKGD